MSTFVDAAGHSWTVRIDINALRRIKEQAGVDLRVIDSGQQLVALANDPLTLVAMLYAALAPQIAAAGLSEEQFAERFAGDVLETAADALVEEIILFFPRRLRAGLAKAWQATNLGIDEGFRLMEQAMDPERIKEQIAQRCARISNAPSSNGSSGIAPESSGSIPAASPSASSS